VERLLDRISNTVPRRLAGVLSVVSGRGGAVSGRVGLGTSQELTGAERRSGWLAEAVAAEQWTDRLGESRVPTQFGNPSRP